MRVQPMGHFMTTYGGGQNGFGMPRLLAADDLQILLGMAYSLLIPTAPVLMPLAISKPSHMQGSCSRQMPGWDHTRQTLPQQAHCMR